MGSSVRELAAATPGTRDRYIDLLRVASLGTVVGGHWLMAVVTGDGVGNLLAVVPELQLLTWALQIMPVFFFVGGFSHALSYRSLSRRTDGSVYAAFLRARLQRLLRPTMVFILVWGTGALIVQLMGGDGGLTGVALRLVAQPLWFIGIYLAMVAFTPSLLKLHERYGWGAFGALLAGAAAVDGLRFIGGVPFVEFLNFAFVWLAVHQLGFLRADGMIKMPSALAAAGLVGAAGLVALGPYPLSMVGMPGEKVSNMAPPTLALLFHGLWLVGAVELLRAPGTCFVQRAAVWRAVVAANGIAMTAFLWHLTAMLGVYGAMLALGVPLPAPASAAWWAQVPVRIAVAAALTALLVAAFRTFERPVRAAPATGSGPAAALGITLCLFGVLGLSMVGFGGMLEGRSAMLVAVRVTAPAAVTMALAGWLLVETAGRGRRS
ncbi:acyltransferase family protein [Streptomyces lunaelactis]|uniref:acyltransferase family protein n=1 Tax=Streptomyces lunaelactis TaxID=1535768 RepID=UPI001585AF01|nr:acyltransferase family protein [Streptomyces lunaelactis]NUK27641.1 acyltransferase family protein [Streptomyces lunaelactis]NUK61975.1 acyltransferase family protein [Streptomyces lunaelactis]NUK75436.1 acyltransferase family protein [Streptomyces lunaelactis]NUK78591.1 acyltransferase family protein [Streptomyces lunaelactis]